MVARQERKVGTAIVLPISLKRRIQKLAEAEDRSMAAYIRQVLQEHVRIKGVK